MAQDWSGFKFPFCYEIRIHGFKEGSRLNSKRKIAYN